MITAIMDTETTGLLKPSFTKPEEQPRIIELAVVLVDKGQIIETFNELINPECKVPEEILVKTGIRQEDVDKAPLFKTFIDPLRALFLKATELTGHNVSFDHGMFHNELRRAGIEYQWPWPNEIFDTVHEFQHKFGYRPSLSQLYEAVLGEKPAQAHRALVDVTMVYRVLEKTGWWA